jgi:hypothetical protein
MFFILVHTLQCMKFLLLILSIVIGASLLLPISFAEEDKIPLWVQEIFIWYSTNEISEGELLNAIEFLVSVNVIEINPISDIDTSQTQDLPTKLTALDDTTSFTFYGLINPHLFNYPIIDKEKKSYFFKFKYTNLTIEEKLNYCPWLLENITVETDKGYIWKYKNNAMEVMPIELCQVQMDPKKQIKSQEYRIDIDKDEKPMFIHMKINGTDYTFNSYLTSPWIFK